MKTSDTRSIVTSASNKFFPSVLNLIGSIKENYEEHPHIYVWDLGLFPTFRYELATIDGVTVVPMPHFNSFWRKCYTWKTYIFTKPFTDITLYLDAGTQVLQPLDEVFAQIKKDGYIAVGQDISCELLVPREYITTLSMRVPELQKEVVTAGIFGFSKHYADIQKVIEATHDASLCGLCLGFSPSEQWKNKRPNKTFFVRDCKLFRHDTTLLSVFLHKIMPDAKITDLSLFSAERHGGEQFVWNLRLLYSKLDYISPSYTKSKKHVITLINRAYVQVFFILKRISKIVKRN
ncbi:hypothetical protein JXR01_01845 [Candidatus Kaiserbacteria bacterium]|nr:MAG: hypothetical protein JXR01_01845 [Candidatus Kaiserbacteria bacterium]